MIGIDAGGSSTRAVVVGRDGTVLGFGRAGSGNPTSAGAEPAIRAMADAAGAALGQAGLAAGDVALLVAAMAGAGLRDDAWISSGLAAAGLPVPATVEADLTAIYLSGSLAPVGCALIVGTGAIAARVRDRRIEAVADGLGWLLGDEGSGYWIGERAARAAAADLDERSGPTALTALVLEELDVPVDPARDPLTRPATLAALLHAVYGRRPVELAALAPAVFTAAESGDAAAAEIVAEAAVRVAHTLLTVRAGAGEVPVVIGGGVIASQPMLADRVRGALRESGADDAVTMVRDGVVGAAVLALVRAGVDVDDVVHARIRDSLTGARG